MDNLDDSENNAKVSDSAYSNSCTNSQSRRSHSSKSTHSGSHSSGSSGYGGKSASKSAYSDSSGNPTEKRSKDKEVKKKKQQVQGEQPTEVKEAEQETVKQEPVIETISEETVNVEPEQSPQQLPTNDAVESMEVAVVEKSQTKEVETSSPSQFLSASFIDDQTPPETATDGFSCVISMHDGVVMYTTLSVTATLGFPKEMWIGRSFIDFVHPKDRNTFASHITSGLAVPKKVNGTIKEATSFQNLVCTMVCRIRKYRGLSSGFGVKERNLAFMPFLLKLSFKNIAEDDRKIIYLVIQATPFFSAFKFPKEVGLKANPFVIRHSANGNVEYIDPEAVPYLGFLPQDLDGKDALQLYHTDDLPYLRQVYEAIVKEGSVPRTKAYRLLTQNGDYIQVETEYSSFTNPWSRKLEFVTGKHHIVVGPENPDVFHTVENETPQKVTEEKTKANHLRESIVRIMNEVLTKPAEVAKQQMSKRCQDLATFMEILLEESPAKIEDELRIDIQEPDNSYFERDSVMLGGISPHHDHNDSKSSTETPLSYTQLNYDDTMQRYFDSHQFISYGNFTSGRKENTPKPVGSPALISPAAAVSGDSPELSSCESACGLTGATTTVASVGEYKPVRLTETLITKHNEEMEKELMKKHRLLRCSTRGERKKVISEKKQKKKEHLARCNASFEPTCVANIGPDSRAQGVKRTSKVGENDSLPPKHHCTSTARRQSKRRQKVTAPAETPPTSNTTTAVAATTNWPCSTNGVNTFIMGVGFPPQMPIMNSQMQTMMNSPMQTMVNSPMQTMVSSPMQTMMNSPMQTMMNSPMQTMMNSPMQTMMNSPMQTMVNSPMQTMVNSPMQTMMNSPMQTMMNSPMQTMMNSPMQTLQGMIPLYYAPAATSQDLQTAAGPSNANVTTLPTTVNTQFPQPMQCMMFGQAMYGSPFMYSPVNLQLACQQQPQLPQAPQPAPATPPIMLPVRHFEKNMPPKLKDGESKGDESKGGESQVDVKCWADSSQTNRASSEANSKFSNDSLRNHFPTPERRPNWEEKKSSGEERENSGEERNRTDGESSYSSFYSSFFKTESGSAEESGDAMKTADKDKAVVPKKHYEAPQINKVAKRKVEPPWMEQVCVTSEFVYKYQILTRSMEEVLKADQLKMSKFEQPALVDEQLGQLYLDLQLEGVAARLTLEEGVSSSSSSGEESNNSNNKAATYVLQQPNFTNNTKYLPLLVNNPLKIVPCIINQIIRRKREYSKLGMIYEEDAPIPPPAAEELCQAPNTSGV